MTKTSLFSEMRGDGRPPALEPPARAMTIGAHPDDAEFGAGGTVARWAEAGCHTTMVIITDGSKGTWDPAIPADRLVETRRAEQRCAADALGAEEVVMLGHVDGELENTRELRQELCLWIRRLRPDVILTHDPWRRYMLHPDHRAAGMAAVDAIVAARDHLFFPEQLQAEGLAKHRPAHLLLWSADEVDHWEDITDGFDCKLAALMCHSSQGTTTMGGAEQDEQRLVAFGERLRKWCEEQGRPVGLELAESFKLIEP